MKDQPLYNLRTCCEDALCELYPAGIPNEVSLRLEREINCLSQKPDCIDNFLLFKEISQAVKQACGKLYLAGTITNSILIYLLGDHELNPMPAHYYCPNCGYYHEELQAVVGLDLPEEKCPHCKAVLRRDGFSLREEYVWKASSEMSFEYRMTSRVIPLAHKVIERHYAGQHRHTALLGWQNSDQLEVSGMVILPAGKGLIDYQEFVGITQDGKECLCYDWHLFERENLKKILLLRLNLLDVLDKVQWETGALADDITPEELYDVSCQNILNTSIMEQGEYNVLFKQKPKTFREKMDLLSATHNTYHAEDSYDSFVSFQEFSEIRCFCLAQFILAMMSSTCSGRSIRMQAKPFLMRKTCAMEGVIMALASLALRYQRNSRRSPNTLAIFSPVHLDNGICFNICVLPSI